MSQKAEIIEKLLQTRKELSDLVADIPPEKEIYPEWRVKELLAHFAGWDDAATAGIRGALSGEDPIIVAPRGPDDYNARTVSERETLPLELIIKEWEHNRQELLELAESVPVDKYDTRTIYPWGEEGTLGELIMGMAEHELYHIAEIRELKPGLME